MRTSAYVLVRADQDDTVFLDFTLAEPVSIEVLDFEALPDDNRHQLDAQPGTDPHGDFGPALAGDAGKEGELCPLGDVMGRELVDPDPRARRAAAAILGTSICDGAASGRRAVRGGCRHRG